jgi:hypothetical protein
MQNGPFLCDNFHLGLSSKKTAQNGLFWSEPDRQLMRVRHCEALRSNLTQKKRHKTAYFAESMTAVLLGKEAFAQPLNLWRTGVIFRWGIVISE